MPYPNNWQAVASKINPIATMFASPNDATQLETFQVLYLQQAQNPKTTDSLNCSSSANVDGTFSMVTIDGKQWTRDACQVPAPGQGPKALTKSIVFQGHTFTISYRAPQAKFSSDQQTIFDIMEQNFHFLG